MNIIVDTKNTDKYFWATYYLQCKGSLISGAKELAIGQSIGNPNARSVWETPEMIEDYSAKILNPKVSGYYKHGIVEIGFPYANINWKTDGVSQLLCFLMGGQMDIDNIQKCHLLKIEIDQDKTDFLGPRYGIQGIRHRTNAWRRPLFGGIIKPKTGITPEQLLEMTKQLCDGGVDFIKEDEILGNPLICPLEERVHLITNYLNIYYPFVVYCFCINADADSLIPKMNIIKKYGGPGVHLNFWSGLGSYKAIRNLNYRTFIHYQKSGDKILTNKNHDFHIDWTVLCELAGLCGVDFIHAGMYGGYLSDSKETLDATFKTLYKYDVMPALSCGMKPELVAPICETFGVEWMANVGGYIHSHPNGTLVGAKEMRKSVEACQIKTWV